MSAKYILMQEAPFTYVAFDSCESDTHTDTSTVTQHNVESGAPITDHVRPDPSFLSLSLKVTNTPLDRDPDFGRGAPQVVNVFTPRWRPTPVGPAAPFALLSQALSAASPELIPVEMFGPVAPYDRIAETEQKLLDLKNASALVAYGSLSREYRDMVITRSEVSRTGPGFAVFSIDLQQIRIVTTAQVAAPVPLEPRGAPLSKKGKQTPATPQDASAMLQSDAVKVWDAGKALLFGGGA